MVIEIPLSKRGKYSGRYVTIVDDCDSYLSERRWNVQIKPNTQYAVTAGKVFIHRFIMEKIINRPLESFEWVDHIDGNGLNNTRQNLRIATRSQNNMNSRQRAGTKSNYKGITLHKQSQKWMAQIRINGKNVYLGLFQTEQEAHKAYCDAAIKFHAEFANLG